MLASDYTLGYMAFLKNSIIYVAKILHALLRFVAHGYYTTIRSSQNALLDH